MSLLKKVLDRESIVKSNIMERLVETVKEIQLKYAAENGIVLTNDEMTNNLCWIIEAIFIHGLKNPFLKSIAFGHKDNAVPEPSFWEYVLIYCHQDVILTVNSLTHIHTDIGRCRAWLRLTLNEGLLHSYLQTMLGDKSTLKEYYKPTALLRDADRCDLLKTYLCGIESYEFNLAFKSSILNSWNSYPLSLVGLWSSGPETISQGIDIASNMGDRDLQALPQLKAGPTPPKSFSSLYDHRKAPLLDEDEALRVILSSGNRGSSGNSSRVSSRRSSDGNPPKLPEFATPTPTGIATTQNTSQPGPSNQLKVQDQNQNHKPCVIPPSTPNDHKESSSVESGISSLRFVPEPPTSKHFSIQDGIEEGEGNAELNTTQDESFSETLSYEALFNSYNKEDGLVNKMTNCFEQATATSSSTAPHQQRLDSTSYNSLEKLSFGDSSKVSSIVFFAQMELQINHYLKVIPREIGLDDQDYKCKGCECSIGMIYGTPRICSLSGFNYCSECHVNDLGPIPPRIILNWDFKPYPISVHAKGFLADIEGQPIFNLKEINPKIYQEVEECGELKVLRSKLKLVSIYLRTCKKSLLIERLERELKPYFYEDIHLYSILDLLNIPNRSLATTLSRWVQMGRVHITSCDICQQKGFICEICRSTQVIFPFDFENIFKCSSCGAVYHSKCLNKLTPCPRCERWRKSTQIQDEDDPES